MHGITIDDIYDDDVVNKLKTLGNKDTVARIVIPKTSDFIRAIEVMGEYKRYITPMIQIQDSFGEREMTDSELFDKASTLFDLFKNDCSFWEIGNEVNGSWVSRNVAARVRRIHELVPSGHKTALTIFWQPRPDLWYADNPILTDYVFISFYPRDKTTMRNPWSGVTWDQVCKKISEINPKAKIGIGEYGLEEWKDFIWPWCKSAILKEMGNPKVVFPGWVGGGFFWDWQRS